MSDTKTATVVEYRVRPVTRYIVTRFYDIEGDRTGVETVAELPQQYIAYQLANALGKNESELIPGVIYPEADGFLRSAASVRA